MLGGFADKHLIAMLQISMMILSCLSLSICYLAPISQPYLLNGIIPKQKILHGKSSKSLQLHPKWFWFFLFPPNKQPTHYLLKWHFEAGEINAPLIVKSRYQRNHWFLSGKKKDDPLRSQLTFWGQRCQNLFLQ